MARKSLTPTEQNERSTKSDFRKNVETVSWIVGIIVGLLVIWQTLSPIFLPKQTHSSRADSVKTITKEKDTLIKGPLIKGPPKHLPRAKDIIATFYNQPFITSDIHITKEDTLKLYNFLKQQPKGVIVNIWVSNKFSESQSYGDEIFNYIHYLKYTNIQRMEFSGNHPIDDPRFSVNLNPTTNAVDIYIAAISN
ncbi:hypothetical protein HDF24_11595 [Mucilaginibacter sp. X4EP1]|uniref:hypothetical protein n=1 Tax=Mucilaginibacter sp. X4EP1 TaxID=2723092 RepID=UPI0021686CCB|nr:hypothetical protein [Mucilaginibacter sp. X4EP1]MCS3812900.1 hypothetical protein [Mucilaginibacter sp. X4EP1]